MSEYNYRLYFPVPQDDDRVGIAAMTVDKKPLKDALPHSEKKSQEAVIYCRGHGPHDPTPQQAERCRAYAKANNLIVLKTFSDDAARIVAPPSRDERDAGFSGRQEEADNGHHRRRSDAHRRRSEHIQKASECSEFRQRRHQERDDGPALGAFAELQAEAEEEAQTLSSRPSGLGR